MPKKSAAKSQQRVGWTERGEDVGQGRKYSGMPWHTAAATSEFDTRGPDVTTRTGSAEMTSPSTTMTARSLTPTTVTILSGFDHHNLLSHKASCRHR